MFLGGALLASQLPKAEANRARMILIRLEEHSAQTRGELLYALQSENPYSPIAFSQTPRRAQESARYAHV